jgi:hypothetical protein
MATLYRDDLRVVQSGEWFWGGSALLPSSPVTHTRPSRTQRLVPGCARRVARRGACRPDREGRIRAGRSGPGSRAGRRTPGGSSFCRPRDECAAAAPAPDSERRSGPSNGRREDPFVPFTVPRSHGRVSQAVGEHEAGAERLCAGLRQRVGAGYLREAQGQVRRVPEPGVPRGRGPGHRGPLGRQVHRRRLSSTARRHVLVRCPGLRRSVLDG